ncbi:MAG TPA: NAD-dependent succinate-semialdehyde dehydrogenase [Anaerolineae bacterium]|nr:NAD-dependent succinate-semialdehyde dehydrogenase [Anaerolineae bacterium]
MNINPQLLKSQAYINGQWTPAHNNETYPITDPATGHTLGHVPAMTTPETRAAITAAHNAFPAWRDQLASQRATLLRRWHDLILDHLDDLATLLTHEMGKPIAEARGEIRYGAGFIEWFAEEAKRIYGDVIPSHGRDKRIITIKQPVGVAAAITPWNFPNAMITRKVAPALAAGCTVVIKPAEDTPLSALALAELAHQADFPPGVINVITGPNPEPIGAELTSNPLVRKLSFTGSTAVGKLLMRQSADTVKKVSFELGGNAPFIVFDDADIPAAVDGAIACKYRNAGQTCVCANRIYVQDAVYDTFISHYAKAVADLTVGAGIDGVDIGPLISEEAVEKVETIVADAVERGAKLKLGGARHPLGRTFYQPTILTDVTMEMACSRQEIFGPVSPIYRFTTDDEVIAMANDTQYGLASYFYARDIGRVWRVAEALEYGMVGINTGMISTPVAPFGGVKESGIGREGSKYGIDEYVEIKYLCMGGLTP